MNFSNNINRKLIGGRGYRKVNQNQVPNFPKLYDKFISEGYDNQTASIKAHSVIQQYIRSQPGYEEEDDEEDLHQIRIITRSIEKMRLETAKLSNKYKNDKNLIKLLNYLNKIINTY